MAKCAHCDNEVAARAPRYDDAILFVCDDAPCQHALEETRQSTLKEEQSRRRTKDVWAEAAELLAQKEIENSQTSFPGDSKEDDSPEEGTQEQSDDVDLGIEGVDADPFDDKPIYRRTTYSRPYFQRYQFHLPVRGGGRQQRTINAFDPAQRPGHSGILDHVPEAVGSFPINTITDIAESMPKSFSVAPLSEKFDYLHVPRQPRPHTAWVFDEVRFKDFIIRKVTDEAVTLFEQNPDLDSEDARALHELAHSFGMSLKAFFNLYNFFLIGQSDAGFMHDPDLKTPRGLWTSETSRQRHRSRLMGEGARLYGTPQRPQPLQDQERTRRLWPKFNKVRIKVAR